MSWKPDPGSVSIDVFPILWNYCYSYCFSPFSLICKDINKIRREFQLALLITTLSPAQSWFPSNPEISNTHTTSIHQETISVTRNNKGASISKKSAGSFSLIKQYIKNTRLPQIAKDRLFSSWCNSTKDRHSSTYQKWEQFHI